MSNTNTINKTEKEVDLNSFSFITRIERKKPEIADNGDIFIEGIASSTSIDSHRTIFTEKCQRGWLEDIRKGLPTYMEANHDGLFDFTKRIGKVVDAKIIPHRDKPGVSNFWIRAKLNPKNEACKEIIRIMESPNTEFGEPESLGLSINGFIQEYDVEIINGEEIEFYDRARLAFVGIVEYPSNPDSIDVALARNLEPEEKYKKIMRARKSQLPEENNSGETKVETPVETAVTQDATENVETNVTATTETTGTETRATLPVKASETEVSAKIANELIPQLNESFVNMVDSIYGVKDANINVRDLLDCVSMFIDKYSYTMMNQSWDFKYENRTQLIADIQNTFNRAVENVSANENHVKRIKENYINIKDEKDVIRFAEETDSIFGENKKEIVNRFITKEIKDSMPQGNDENTAEKQVERKAEEATETKPDSNSELVNTLRSLNTTIVSLQEEIKSVKTDNEALRSAVKELGDKPASTPAQEFSTENQKRDTELTLDELVYLAGTGALDERTVNMIGEAQLRIITGKR
jgi:hypothetical protein